MKPQVSTITLAVGNLEKAVRFYRDGLGWKTRGIVGTDYEYGAAAYFELQPGLCLALRPRASLAHEAGVEVQAPAMTEFMLTHHVSEKAEVAHALSLAAQAGAQIRQPAQDTFLGGHAGIFKDPDGHLWEVAWHPQPASLSSGNPAP